MSVRWWWGGGGCVSGFPVFHVNLAIGGRREVICFSDVGSESVDITLEGEGVPRGEEDLERPGEG